MSSSHETILYVDLKAIEHNFYYFKSKLDPTTEIIAVVKAFAYGHGDITIAKKLEELGIGRPSTYATILTKILDKEYARKEKGALIPTFTGYAIVHFLEKYFDDLVNLQYTAEMENHIDEIASGDLEK